MADRVRMEKRGAYSGTKTKAEMTPPKKLPPGPVYQAPKPSPPKSGSKSS